MDIVEDEAQQPYFKEDETYEKKILRESLVKLFFYYWSTSLAVYFNRPLVLGKPFFWHPIS